MKVSLEGMGELIVTLEVAAQGDGAVNEGDMVKLTGNGKAAPCGKSGDVPAGVVRSVRDGYAAVQVAGYAKLPCAASLTVGWHNLALGADGKVTEASGGRGALVTDVENGVCGAIL